MNLKNLARFLVVASIALTCRLAAEERPNVILIISDDHHYEDYGFMGSERVNTPAIDKLANESLTYTRGYTMPVCSPTLASLLTGKMPHQHGITGNDLADQSVAWSDRDLLAERLLSNSVILPKALGEAGYLTFQTGKLWNGTYEEMGFTHGMTTKGSRHGDKGLSIGREGMEPIFEFIEKAKEAQKPFFIWHAPFLPHTPHNPPERLHRKYRGEGPTPAAEKYFAMVEWLDETTGELEDYLVENDLKENTVILYLADNGWNAEKGNNGQRAKMSPYEGGIRTPIFIRWPGKVTPKMDRNTLAHVTDLTRTILNITGADYPDDLTGLDLRDHKAMSERETVFIEAYTHDIADLAAPSKSLYANVVINGWWKLLIPTDVEPKVRFATKPRDLELYNLRDDPYETRNLASEHPDIVARLKQLQKDFWDPGMTHRTRAQVASEMTATTRGIIDLGHSERPANAIQLIGRDKHLLIPEKENGKSWSFEDGILTATPKWHSLVTPDDYTDFRLHVEFKVNSKPDADKREADGNSGIYIQQRYEVQIHNSHGISEEDYTHAYGGSLYKLKKPDKLVSKPAGEWQSYDIVFRAARFEGEQKTENARITVYHNGVLIHDDFEIPRKTGAGKQEGPDPRPIKFQAHDNPVMFRNTWIQPLSLEIPAKLKDH